MSTFALTWLWTFGAFCLGGVVAVVFSRWRRNLPSAYYQVAVNGKRVVPSRRRTIHGRRCILVAAIQIEKIGVAMGVVAFECVSAGSELKTFSLTWESARKARAWIAILIPMAITNQAIVAGPRQRSSGAIMVERTTQISKGRRISQ